jgi:hypothetical protein
MGKSEDVKSISIASFKVRTPSREEREEKEEDEEDESIVSSSVGLGLLLTY